MLVEKLKSIAISDDDEAEDPLENDLNIMQLTPFNFDQQSKNPSKDVLVCFYNSEKNDKFIEKMVFDFKKLADWYKND